MDGQQAFIDRVGGQLGIRGLEPRTLGVTDHDRDTPLKAIRHLMLASRGLIAIAFRRTYIKQDQWLTSPWVHIESAMAYQIGLPILILREQGVTAEGLLENGVAGICMPAFDLGGALDCYFTSPEWRDLISRWEVQVRHVSPGAGAGCAERRTRLTSGA
jgi:hypothetical protein